MLGLARWAHARRGPISNRAHQGPETLVSKKSPQEEGQQRGAGATRGGLDATCTHFPMPVEFGCWLVTCTGKRYLTS